MLLIIPHKEDYTVDFIINQLNATALPYFRLNCEELLAYRYNVSFPAGKPLALESIERFTAVLFRRVKQPVLTLAETHVARLMGLFSFYNYQQLSIGSPSVSKLGF